MHTKEYKALTIPKVGWANLTATTGDLKAGPLEPGFGITLGNALRRVLLGGIEGSAVTAVIIKGVNNEFSALPGVIEDAMQIILNCKQIVIRNKTGHAGKMKLVVHGQAQATVNDIKADDHLELINKDLVLAQVAQGGTLDIEFFVEQGRGYMAAAWPIGTALQEDGRIYIDAMFSPVRKVTYEVEKTRVGRDIDYDKLSMTIETDGTETPTTVFHYAVSVLRTQLEYFLTAPEIPFNELNADFKDGLQEVVNGQQAVDNEGLGASVNELLHKPIDVLELSVRAQNCLINAGIKNVSDIVVMTEDQVRKIKNFGSKSFDEVQTALHAFGLTLGMKIKE
jgi:DNA-directed RNA polymerase subunit alpha